MKPVLMLYCQHSVGIGHLTRSLALAQALTRSFHVVFLNGGPFPPGVPRPADIEFVDLPPLGLGDGRGLISRDDRVDVDTARTRRRDIVLGAFHARRPEVLVVELFPFGRKKFAFELLPLLKAARRSTAPRPLVVSSVRDILVGGRSDQQHHDDRAAWLCNRYFDAVLVHADPRIADFATSFQPQVPLDIPLLYTGFVARDGAVDPAPRGDHVLVSAGGGIVGGELLRTALRAHGCMPGRRRRPMRLVAGPFLPEAEWRALQDEARGLPDVTLLRAVPDLGAEMRTAAVSVSQCGYNTAMDILASRVPAVVVPYSAGTEDEQMARARRFADAGWLLYLAPQLLDPERLAGAIDATADFRPAPLDLDLDGAGESERILRERCLGRAGCSGADGWVREVRRVA